MAIGLVTTYPTNAWLVRRGVKRPMGRPHVSVRVERGAVKLARPRG
jgi:hypothetical protein